jgi:Spy/CpxP family protein refolding chaperone
MALRRAEPGLGEPGEALERLRSDFQREAIKREADLRVAEVDVTALLARDQVDLAAVEAKVRAIERLRADLRLARIRTIEQGRAQLTPEQREKLRALVAEPRSPFGSGPPAPPPPRGRL